MGKRIGKDLEQVVINGYLFGKSSCKLHKEFNIAEGSVFNILKRNNIAIRPKTIVNRIYAIDETVFDEIDTQDKAYVLGFIYADGNIHIKENRLSISIAGKDKELLEKFQQFFKTNRPIGHYQRERPDRKTEFVSLLTINNEHIAKRIKELGIVPRKTFKITFPTFLRKDLIRHFIRGYFDGDGCLSIAKVERERITDHYSSTAIIIGTKNFCEKIQEILRTILDVNSWFRLKYQDCIGELRISGNNQVLQFLDWIYKDATIYLDRKNEKYCWLRQFVQGRGKVTRDFRKSCDCYRLRNSKGQFS